MDEDRTITEETACSENKSAIKRSIRHFLNDPTQYIYKVALWSTVIMTVLAHGFLFANEFFSHDSLSNMSYSLHSLEYYTMIGRFLIPFYERLKGYDLTAPWVVGILFVVWMSASSYLAARFFVVSNKWSIALISGLLCTNIALSLTGATYIYCLDEYAFSLFAAIAAAYCFCRLKRLKYLGILFVVMSLGFYQAYVTVTVCLCFVDVMHRLIKNEESSTAIFARGLRHVALTVVGGVLYYIVWQAMCNILNVTVVKGNGNHTLGRAVTDSAARFKCPSELLAILYKCGGCAGKAVPPCEPFADRRIVYPDLLLPFFQGNEEHGQQAALDLLRYPAPLCF